MDRENNDSKEFDAAFSEGKLVLGINSLGDITWFNRECERITRYNRRDVITKKMSDILIPKNYMMQWMEIFEDSKKDRSIDEIVLPILTKEGDELLVSWNPLSIGNRDEIIFVGVPVSTMKIDRSHKSPSADKGKHDELSRKNKSNRKKISIKSETVPGAHRVLQDDIEVMSNDKKIDSVSNREVDIRDHRKEVKREDRREERRWERRQIRELKQTIRKLNKRISELERDKKEIIQKMLREVELFQQEKKDIIREMNKSLNKLKTEKDEIIRDLMKKNEGLEKKIYILRKKYDTLNSVLEKERKKKEELEKARQVFERNIARVIKNGTSFLINCVGGKEKKKIFYSMAQELDKRRKALDVFEKKLREEAENLSKKKEDFVRWREKLEELEGEIERRREELMKQEELFDNYVFSTLWSTANREFDEPKIKKEIDNVSKIDFNEVDESAVVLQRNILKQVNEGFQTLLGYREDEIINKSLSDIVAPESIAELRRYYLNRLKGGQDDAFEMVFLTKNNDRIPVEVTTRPTLFNGENADILILTPLDKK